MKCKKQITLLLCVVLIVSSMFCMGVFAFAASSISIETVTTYANPGESVSVPVVIKNNTGLMGFKLIFDYDERALEPMSIEYGDILSGGIQDNIEGDSQPGEFCVYWAGSENMSADGTLFYIVMKVKDDAYQYSWGYGGDSGYQLRIDVSFSQEDTFDEDFNDVQISTAHLWIKLNDTDITWSSWNYCTLDRNMENIDSVTAGDTFIIATGNCKGSHDCDDLQQLTLNVKYNTEVFEFLGWSDGQGQLYENIPVVDDGDIIISYNSEDIDKASAIDSDFPGIDIYDEDNEVYGGYIFVFKVKDRALSGSYAFDFVGLDYNVDYFSVEGCSINVLPSATSEIAEISISDGITGQNGDTISVPVYIENNHGIMGYRITVKYNPEELEIVSAEKSNDFGGTFNDSIGNKTGEFDLLWNSTEEVIKDGALFTLKFNVITQNNVSSEIELSYSQEDTFNEEYKDVVFNCNNAVLKLCYQHIYSQNTVSPTCTEQGYSDYVCSGCGDSYTTDYTDAVGHMYKYTGNSDSEMNYICDDCGEHIAKSAQQIYAMWDIKYVNKPPQRTEVDNSCYLNTVTDNIINAKDFAIINRLSKIPVE